MEYVLFGLFCFVFGCAPPDNGGYQYQYNSNQNLNFEIQFPKQETEPQQEQELPPPPVTENEDIEIMKNEVIKVSPDESFDSVKSASTITVIDFGAVWCVPCKNLFTEIERIAEENTDVSFYSVDIDNCPGLRASAGNVSQVPTVIIYKDGVEFKRIVGNDPEGVAAAITEARE